VVIIAAEELAMAQQIGAALATAEEVLQADQSTIIEQKARALEQAQHKQQQVSRAVLLLEYQKVEVMEGQQQMLEELLTQLKTFPNK